MSKSRAQIHQLIQDASKIFLSSALGVNHPVIVSNNIFEYVQFNAGPNVNPKYNRLARCHYEILWDASALGVELHWEFPGAGREASKFYEIILQRMKSLAESRNKKYAVQLEIDWSKNGNEPWSRIRIPLSVNKVTAAEISETLEDLIASSSDLLALR